MKRNALRRLILISFGGAALFFARPIFAQAGQEMNHPIPSGASAAAAAAKDEEERKDPEYGSVKKSKERFTYGKRKEEAVESKGSTNSIQKTKDGSADATVPTGVFKDSLLDVDLPNEHHAAKPTPTPAERVNPLRRAKIEAQPAASPAANPAAAVSPAPLTSSPLDITLGVSPAPTATPVPQSH
jgi:hypothetical protein